MENKQARENLRTILKGKPPRRELSLEEAKVRLRAADPSIDISRPLQQLSSGNLKEAGLALAVEAVTSMTVSYMRPLFTSAFLGLHGMIVTRRKQHNKV